VSVGYPNRTCGQCGAACEERTAAEVVTWGSDDPRRRYPDVPAPQRIPVVTVYWHCPACGEEFLDMRQAASREQQMNEWLKATLGFDWLAANAADRARRARRVTDPDPDAP
jgi:hypothetical protein